MDDARQEPITKKPGARGTGPGDGNYIMIAQSPGHWDTQTTDHRQMGRFIDQKRVLTGD